MTKSNIKRVTTILTRLIYFIVASALVVALLTTLERGILSGPAESVLSTSTEPRVNSVEGSKSGTRSGLLGGLISSSQTANLSLPQPGTWETYDTSNSGLVSNYVLSMAMDNEGNMWFGTTQGVSKFDGTTWTTYDTSNSGLAFNSISSIAVDLAGSVWFGTRVDDGLGYGVSKFDGMGWTTYNKANGALKSDSVNATAVDTSGHVWVGTSAGGASRYNGVGWMTYRGGSGLASRVAP